MQMTDQTTSANATGTGQDHGFRSGVADAAQREMDDLRSRASETMEQVREETRNAGSTVSRLVSDELDKRRQTFGTDLKAVTDAIRDAARQNDVTSPMMTQAVHILETASNAVEKNSVQDIGQALTDFGRRNPAAFVAACVLTGLAAGRFLTATDRDGMGTGNSRSGETDLDLQPDDFGRSTDQSNNPSTTQFDRPSDQFGKTSDQFGKPSEQFGKPSDQFGGMSNTRAPEWSARPASAASGGSNKDAWGNPSAAGTGPLMGGENGTS